MKKLSTLNRELEELERQWRRAGSGTRRRRIGRKIEAARARIGSLELADRLAGIRKRARGNQSVIFGEDP